MRDNLHEVLGGLMVLVKKSDDKLDASTFAAPFNTQVIVLRQDEAIRKPINRTIRIRRIPHTTLEEIFFELTTGFSTLQKLMDL